MKTLREAVASYIEWTKKAKVKVGTRSQNFWKRRERVLSEHVIPVLGDKPMSEISEIMFRSLEDSIKLTREGSSTTERNEALNAAMGVLQHYQTGR